jgi:hypothetical protein
MYCTKCGSAIADGQKFCGACGAPAVVPVMQGDRSSRPPRPTAIVVISAFLLIVALLLSVATSGFFSFLMLGPNFKMTAAVIGVLAGLVLVVVAAVATAIGLMNLRPFGRTLALAFAWLGLLLFPLGTIVSIILLRYLLKPETAALFPQAGLPGDEPKPEPWPIGMKVFTGLTVLAMAALIATASIRRTPTAVARAADLPALELGILSDDGLRLVPDVDNLSAQDVAEVSLLSSPGGMPEVQIRFTPSGSAKMERLSSVHVGSRMAFIVDGKIDTAQAAVIQSPLSEYVSMSFSSQEDAKRFVDGMNH